MITFFRRLRQSFLSENKFSKYLIYAIGEIILVVIGILIALQINNWNEKRQDSIKEQSILASLHKEFKANRIQFDSVLTVHKRALNGCEKLMSMFPIDVERDNLDSISKHLWSTTFVYTFNPSQGIINSITNTSSFDIISNAELRELLVSWPDIVLDLQEDEIQSKGVLFNQMDPFFADNFTYNFNLKDERTNLKALESLKFEYVIGIMRETIKALFESGAELEIIDENLNRIIELTKPKGDD